MTLPGKATHQQTRGFNRGLVLRTLYDYGPVSRAEVARLTGLTRTTVSELVGDARRAARCRSVRIRVEREVLPVEVDRPAGSCRWRRPRGRRADADAEDRAGLRGPARRARRPRAVSAASASSPSRPSADTSRVARTSPRRFDEGAGEHALAEVDRDDQPGVVDDLEQDRGLAAARRPEAYLADEALGEDVGDELADGGAGEPGEAGDLGAADRPVVVQRAQDEAAVEPARLLVRRLARERHSRRPPPVHPAGRGGRDGPPRLCQVS